jgi:hypothetical protein
MQIMKNREERKAIKVKEIDGKERELNIIYFYLD